MRVRFKREWEGFGAGLLTDLDDERAKKAVGDGAAEEMHPTRMAKDFRDKGGQVFAANFDYDLTAEQLKQARAEKAVPEEKKAAGEATGADAAEGETADAPATRKRHKGASHGAEE